MVAELFGKYLGLRPEFEDLHTFAADLLKTHDIGALFAYDRGHKGEVDAPGDEIQAMLGIEGHYFYVHGSVL